MWPRITISLDKYPTNTISISAFSSVTTIAAAITPTVGTLPKMSSPTSVRVAIIGGGVTGLCLSIFLSSYSIPHILFEKRSGTSLLSQAHYLNQRTMEIFRKHGLSEELEAEATPIHHMSKVEWKTSFSGDEIYDAKVLGSIRAFGGQPDSPEYETYRLDSPVVSSNLPLLRLEPLLRRVAEARNPGCVRFGHYVTDFEEKDSSVSVTVKQPDEQTVRYHAKYLVAADGGKMSTAKLGIQMQGSTGLSRFVSAHFKADLSEYWDGTPVFVLPYYWKNCPRIQFTN
jgi:2,4-dichlorophenol 6-monooxygenase